MPRKKPDFGQMDQLREMLPDAHGDRSPFRRRHIPVLIALLRDPNSCNRGDALLALSKLKARQAIPGMIRCLRDPDWLVRCDAAEALGAVGDARAVPSLRRALRSRNPHVRSYVAMALGDLGDLGSRRKLESMYSGNSVRDRLSASGPLYLLTGNRAYLEELGRFVREAPRYELRYSAFHDLLWVMRAGDRVDVRSWLSSALRVEKESPGLRKDLRKALRSL